MFREDVPEVLFFHVWPKVLCTPFQSAGKLYLLLLAFQGFTTAQVI